MEEQKTELKMIRMSEVESQEDSIPKIIALISI